MVPSLRGTQVALVLWYDQLGRIDQGYVALFGPFVRSAANDHIVLADQQTPGQFDRVLDPLHGGNRTYLQGGPVHNASIQLDHPGLIEMGAGAGIKSGIVFQNSDGGFYCLQSRTTGEQAFIAGQSRDATTSLVGLVLFLGDAPGPTVNDDGRFHGLGPTGAEIFEVKLHLPLPVPLVELKGVDYVNWLRDMKLASPMPLPKGNSAPRLNSIVQNQS